MLKRLYIYCRMIIAWVCALALLSAQIPLYAQTNEWVSREQAIAHIQRSLDTLIAIRKAAEPRFNTAEIKKASGNAMDKLGVSARSRGESFFVNLSAYEDLSGWAKELFTYHQRQLEEDLAFFKGEWPDSLTTEKARAAGWAVKKTYIDKLDRGMAKLKQRIHEVTDLLSRWIEAEALKWLEWDKFLANGTRHSKEAANRANEIYLTLLQRLQDQLFSSGFTDDMFAPVGHQTPGSNVSKQPPATEERTPEGVALTTALVDEEWLNFWGDFLRTLPWKTTEITRRPEPKSAYKLLVVSGANLPAQPPAVRADSTPPRIRYEVLSVATASGTFNPQRESPDTEFGRLERADYTLLWQKAWQALSSSTGVGLSTLQSRNAYLLLVKYRHGEMPGQKRFTVGERPAAWVLDRGNTVAIVRFVRPIRDTESDGCSVAYVGDRLQLEVRLSSPTPVERIEIVLGKNGQPAQIGGKTTLVAMRKSTGRKFAYLTEQFPDPAYVTEPFALRDAKSRATPTEPFVLVAQGDQLHALITDSVSFRTTATTIEVKTAPEPVWRWAAALQRAGQAVPRSWDGLRSPAQAEVASLSEFIIFTTGQHFQSTIVRRGDLAAMLLLRDRFVSLTQAYLQEMPKIDSPREVLGFLKLIEPSIRDNSNPLGRVKVSNPFGIGLTGFSPYIQLREAVADPFLRERFAGPGAARDFTVQKVHEALDIYKRRTAEAVQKAQSLRDGDVSALLNITSFGFNAVVADLVPDLVVPRLNANREVIGWVPDYTARKHVKGIATLGETVRAQRELAKADAAVFLAAASLVPIVGPANLFRLVTSLGLGAVDASEAIGDLVGAEQEHSFALGASAVLGTERLDVAEAQKLPLWAQIATLAGAGVGVAGDVLELAGRANLSVARTRASALIKEVELGGFNAFSRLSPDEQAQLLAVLVDARLRRANAGELVGAEDQRWIQLADRLAREGAEAAQRAGKPPTELGGLLDAGRLKPADPALRSGMPTSLRERVPIDLDTNLPGNTVQVRYRRDASGLITDVRMRVGPNATKADIALHAKTARLILRYSGLSGRIRVLLDRLRILIGRHGDPPIGSRAWEAKLEVQKLPDIIRDRLERLKKTGLSPNEEADILAECAYLEEQLARHQETLDRMDLEAGEGFVAAMGRGNEEAFAAGYPRPLPENHYFRKFPDGSFQLQRFSAKNSPLYRYDEATKSYVIAPDGRKTWADRKTQAGTEFEKPSGFAPLETRLANKVENSKWSAGDAGQIRKWEKLIKELHDKLDASDRDQFLDSLLGEIPAANFSESQYDRFRYHIRERIVQRLINGHRGREQIDELRRFVELQPDDASKGALFTAYRSARINETAPGHITGIAEIPDVRKALPNGRYADGAIEVLGPLEDGPPKGRFLVDDKAGADPFKLDQARDYHDLLVQNGRIATTDGVAYNGLAYIFQSPDAALSAAATLKRHKLSPDIHVAYFDQHGELIWVRR